MNTKHAKLLSLLPLLLTALVVLLVFACTTITLPGALWKDLLPLLPKNAASWPILKSLRKPEDLLPSFVGMASPSSSSSDSPLEWKGACFYQNKAWVKLHNRSRTPFGGGTLHIKGTKR